MRLPPSVAASGASLALSVLLVSSPFAPPALAADSSFEVQKGFAADSKMQGGGASTLQSGRRITITRGVNLDGTDWRGKNLKGVAFQQSVLRNCDFSGVNLFSASFFDADLAKSKFVNADMRQINLEMADLSGTDLTGADLTEAYMAGAVIKGLTQIDDTDWTDVQMRKDQRTYLCSVAKGTNPKTGMDTRDTLMCP